MKKNRNSTNFPTIPTQYSTAKTPTKTPTKTPPKMCEALIYQRISIGGGMWQNVVFPKRHCLDDAKIIRANLWLPFLNHESHESHEQIAYSWFRVCSP